MSSRRTEHVSDSYRGLDTWPAESVLAAMIRGQASAIAAVERALPAIATAAEALAARFEAGGRLIYVGAGSSGVIARLDALELPGTYGLPKERIVTLLAGGEDSLRDLNGGAEDDEAEARSAFASHAVDELDSVIGISASGTTPYLLAAMETARSVSALTIGIACNPDTPLLMRSDHAILLDSDPEVIAGSTRMNAGTAQKCALNLLSSLICVRLGHVYDGMMVNLQAENAKLRTRATEIVTRIGGVEQSAAEKLLERTKGAVKPAVLMAAGIDDVQAATSLLVRFNGNLRSALEQVAASSVEAENLGTETLKH